MRLLTLTFTALAISPFIANGEPICPWLSSATAAGVLGGPVTTAVSHSAKNKEDATCEFTHQARVTYTLRIEVTTMSHLPTDFTSWLTQCGPNATPVRGIGNQAVACDLKDSVAAQILSRVRERAFLVRVTANKSSIPLQPLRDQARSVADQVSGNLF
ncbi:MAG: hypothetical protein JO210_11085 [Acidobacteriaceae bacterium]|nr:hypothetical protein [Acidobacteriaceae bacterium]